MPGLAELRVVRAAASLTAAGAQTDKVACFGAAKVSWILRATNATVLSVAMPQVSMDGTLWMNADVAGDTGRQGDATAKALDAGGASTSLCDGFGSPGGGLIWRYARLDLDTAGTVTGLEVKVTVFFNY